MPDAFSILYRDGARRKDFKICRASRNPMVFKLYKSAGDIGKRTLDMWQKEPR